MGILGNRRGAEVNLAIIAANVVWFIVLTATGSLSSMRGMVEHGAMYVPYVTEYGQEWRLLSSAFVHFDIRHIANNMFILFMLGDNLERALGHVKYFIFYILGALGGNILSMQLELAKGSYAVSGGASGAVFAVIGGLLWAVIANRGRLEDLTTKQLFILAALSLYFGFTSTGVDNAAHVGGLVTGFILSMLMYRKRRRASW